MKTVWLIPLAGLALAAAASPASSSLLADPEASGKLQSSDFMLLAQAGNGNVGNANGNANGNAHVGFGNGNGGNSNGNNNVGAFNGNFNGNGNR